MILKTASLEFQFDELLLILRVICLHVYLRDRDRECLKILFGDTVEVILFDSRSGGPDRSITNGGRGRVEKATLNSRPYQKSYIATACEMAKLYSTII
jgi:hypothetical protein